MSDVSDAREVGAGRTIDLSRLNGSELRVLRLLAEGHTVKSIANATELTPAAVNERLREARRKTGIGSSRELARMVRRQKSSDEEIGVASRPKPTFHQPFTGEATASPDWKGPIAMILALVTALSAAALIAHQPTVQSDSNNQVINDPLFGPIPTGENSPARLYRQLRAERRDPAWSPRAEQELRDYFIQIPYIGGPSNHLRVTCSSSLCEIVGQIAAPVSKQDDSNLNSQLNRTMAELQSKKAHEYADRLGLNDVSGTFEGPPGKRSAVNFLLYFQRKH